METIILNLTKILKLFLDILSSRFGKISWGSQEECLRREVGCQSRLTIIYFVNKSYISPGLRSFAAQWSFGRDSFDESQEVAVSAFYISRYPIQQSSIGNYLSRMSLRLVWNSAMKVCAQHIRNVWCLTIMIDEDDDKESAEELAERYKPLLEWLKERSSHVVREGMYSSPAMF